jgi:AhpD family alkylhydroperoxidase
VAGTAFDRQAAQQVKLLKLAQGADQAMARVRFIEQAATQEGNQLIAEIKARRGGTLLNLDKVLLHSPALARGWNHFLGAVRRQTKLPGALRELAILRVAMLNQAQYEFIQHAPEARKEGVSDAVIAAVKEQAIGATFGGLERRVLEYTDAMTRDIRVPQPLFDAVCAELGEEQMVELSLTIAAYNMVSRFLEAMQIEPEQARI